MNHKVYITALDENGGELASISFLEKYIREKRWNVISAALSRLVSEINNKRALTRFRTIDVSGSDPTEQSLLNDTDIQRAIREIKRGCFKFILAIAKIAVAYLKETEQ